ncbi:hypothetical protein ACFQV8_07180 [Pseudonocardia benzenivorans]
MVRVAVAPGADRTRVAVADPAPRVVAELAGRVDPGEAVRLLFDGPSTLSSSGSTRPRPSVARRRGSSSTRVRPGHGCPSWTVPG